MVFDLKKSKIYTNETSIEFTNEIASYLIPLPLVSAFCIVSNLINIFVFLHPKMKDVTFKCMLSMSISHLLYSGLLIYNVYFYCGTCSVTKTYASQIYRILINFYFTSCLAIFSHFCELFISIKRYLILKNLKLNNTKNKWILFTLIIVSLLFYLSELFAASIEQTEVYLEQNSSYTLFKINYSTDYTNFGKSYLNRLISMFQVSIRVFISMILLSAINIANLYEFNKRYTKRFNFSFKYQINSNRNSLSLNEMLTITPNSYEITRFKANRNMTLMVICTTSLSIFLLLPRNIYLIYKGIFASKTIYIYSYVTTILYNLTNGLNFFIYFFFNKMFRQILISYFRQIKKKIF